VPNLALFDFDGTITFSGTFLPFVYQAVEPTRMAVGKVVLSPLIAAYKLGILSSSRMRASIVRVGFRGRQAVDVRRIGLEYGREALPGVVRPEALEKIRWHKGQGDCVAVVSASIDVYLSEWCSDLGLDLICNEFETRDGVLTGRYRDGDCSGKEKSKRVLQNYDLGTYPVIYAYGDTEEDAEMLSLAHKKYLRWREVAA
jgi:phosphatidylglycerophosphatase C